MLLPEIQDKPHWFVMRDLKRANAKLPAYKQLAELQFEVFTPMKETLSIHDGKRIREKVPFIRDLLFVRSTRETLDPVVDKTPTIQYRFQKGSYKIPMTVAEDEMKRFIHAVSETEKPLYFLPGELTPAMYGRDIKIIGGALDGYEGKLLTIRGSKKKRLLVELPGFLQVGIEVNPQYISLL